MADRRLQRKLRRINDGPGPPRAVFALLCLALLGAAAAAWPDGAGPVPPTGLLALLPGLAWLRRYQAARPRAGTIITHVAIGAFLGACVAGIALDAPDTTRAWLRAPAIHGGPAITLVLVTALLEDLVAALRRRFTR